MNKKAEFVKAIQNICLESDKLFLVVTGDIAFSGLANEYYKAMEFFDFVKESIDEYTKKELDIIMIPGNHDCNFKDYNKTRDNLIESILNNGEKVIDDSVIDNCCSVQKEWEEFNSCYTNGEIIFCNKLLNIKKYTIDNYNILFYSYNTSWISKIIEKPCFIYFPFKYFDSKLFEKDADLIISLLHHPINWQQNINQRDFKLHLEKYSNIILIGHEHIFTGEKNINLEGIQTLYIQGENFQDINDKNYSGFNILIIETNNKIMKLKKFEWNEKIYRVLNEYDNIKINDKNKNKIIINDEFNSWLDDTEAFISHPAKGKLNISDIYVDPNVIDIKTINKKEEINKEMSLSDIFNNINNKKLLIIGEENSGKTTICKMIFKKYYDNNYFPLYIEGNKIKSANNDDIEKLLYNCYKDIYNSSDYDEYLQIPNNKKIIIIDNFEKCKVPLKNKGIFLNRLMKLYPNIIITGNELIQFNEYIQEDYSAIISKEFEQYKIIKFGHSKRSELINKWLYINNNMSYDTLLKLHDRIEIIINEVIGNNLVPSYPLFLLIILQTIEAGKPHDLKESTYGYYYSYLITRSLEELKLPQEDIDAYYNYMIELAYYLFSKDIRDIDKVEFENFHRQYCIKYQISLEFSKIEQDFTKACILKEKNGNFSFRYKYIYYYSLAKYISNNLSDSNIRKKIEDLCSHIYVDEYANILLFLTHHSKDKIIINNLLKNIKKLFKDVKPIKFDNDINSINELINELPKLVIKNINIEKNRIHKLRKMDKLYVYENEDVEESAVTVENADDNSNFLDNIYFAFKAIEIIGQVLKNYYGSLIGEIKFNLVEESYYLILRCLNFIIIKLSENKDILINYIKEIIQKRDIKDDKKIEKYARSFLFFLAEDISYVFIKKVSECLGSEKLNMTFNDVKNKNDSVAINLIDVSIKLNFYNLFPFNDIENLVKRLTNNALPLLQLRLIVLNYIYMYPLDYKSKQRIASILKIPIETQRKAELFVQSKNTI